MTAIQIYPVCYSIFCGKPNKRWRLLWLLMVRILDLNKNHHLRLLLWWCWWQLRRNSLPWHEVAVEPVPRTRKNNFFLFCSVRDPRLKHPRLTHFVSEKLGTRCLWQVHKGSVVVIIIIIVVVVGKQKHSIRALLLKSSSILSSWDTWYGYRSRIGFRRVEIPDCVWRRSVKDDQIKKRTDICMTGRVRWSQSYTCLLDLWIVFGTGHVFCFANTIGNHRKNDEKKNDIRSFNRSTK